MYLDNASEVLADLSEIIGNHFVNLFWSHTNHPSKTDTAELKILPTEYMFTGTEPCKLEVDFAVLFCCDQALILEKLHAKVEMFMLV